MTYRTGCVLVITSELTVANPVGGFRTSNCGRPGFKPHSEISYLPSSISRKVGTQATADSFHIPSSCPPVKQWLRRSSCGLHLVPHASIRPTVKTLARTCSSTLSVQNSNLKRGHCSLQAAVVEKLVKEFRTFLKP